MRNKNSYYKVGTLGFDSKLDACIFAQVANKPVQWHFDAQEVFDKYDWSTEPEMSLDFYYDKRAREIREKYEYIVVMYSGGADSHNLLLSFIRQGLFVDEIIVSHVTELADKQTDYSGKCFDPFNVVAEHQLNTIPKLRDLKNHLTNTTFTVIDMSDRVLNYIDSNNEEDWIFNYNDIQPIWNVTRDWFHTTHFKRLLDCGKRVGIVMGAEKPRTLIKDGVFYTTFIDNAFSIGTPQNYKHSYTNLTVEYFYWDKTAVDMLCKQAHIVKRNLEANPQLHKLWDAEHIGERYSDVFKTYHERMMIPWIYTTWDNGFQAAKALGGVWDNEYDYHWWKSKTDNRRLEIFNRGLDYFADKTKNFIHFKNGKPQRLRSFILYYSLGQMNNAQVL